MRFRQVHLDFHTSEKILDIGSKFSKEQFQAALIAGHVDSITVFSKCHHGWSYHPTIKNKMHPCLNFDLLGAQIEAAHEIGVKANVYLSAGLDEQYAREHPEYILDYMDHGFNNFGEPGFHGPCMNTPYLDHLLEQTIEVLENYDADGLFYDIVGVRSCCCPSCIKTMLSRGMDPSNPDDVLKLGEEVYANYVNRVRQTVDSIRPGLPVFHNGGHIRHGRRDLIYKNSHLELESLPTGGWGYDHFPISAKYAQTLGLEYLGMTGRFHKSWGEFGGYKHPNALRYEVLLAATMGAKSSIGDQLHPDGMMDMKTYEMIGEAYAEIEQKEDWLKDSKPIAEIALLSVEAYNNCCVVESGGFQLTNADIGAGRILLEGKYQFAVIDVEANFDDYKVIILPDLIVPDERLYEKLKNFVSDGGKILASGNSGIKNDKFMFDFGAEYLGESEYEPSYIRPLTENKNETDYIMYSAGKNIKTTDGVELAKTINPYFNRTKEHFCSHLHTPSSKHGDTAGVVVGKDGAYIAWDIFRDYAENGELIAKTTVCQTLDYLLGDSKILTTDLGSMGRATVAEQKNRYVVHLLYAVPTRRGQNVEIIEDIYPVHNISVSLNTDKDIKRVYLAPQCVDIPFKRKNGRININDITIDCHQMIVFEY